MANKTERFSPPSELIQGGTTLPGQEDLKALLTYADEENLKTVTLIVTPPMRSLQNRKEFVEGMISGMSKKGFELNEVSEIAYQEYPVIEVTGYFNLPEGYGRYQCRALVLFTDENTYALSMNWHDSIKKPEYVDAILDRLQIEGKPPPRNHVSSPSEDKSDIYKTSEKIGEYTGYLLLAVVLLKAFQRILKKCNTTL